MKESPARPACRDGISLHDVKSAIENNNANVGGQYIITGHEENLVRGIGLLRTIEDIRDITLKTIDGPSFVNTAYFIQWFAMKRSD